MNGQDQQSEQFFKQERRRLKNERKREESAAQRRKEQHQKMVMRLVWVLIGVGVIAAFVYKISNQKILPPTSQQGHIERSPESHLLTEPMDSRIHAHMLEHADGSGSPGIIINYNCEQFDCELGFVDSLAKFVEEYPQNVYVAPYKNMAAKLVLTREGQQKVLDSFDEQRIREFIER